MESLLDKTLLKLGPSLPEEIVSARDIAKLLSAYMYARWGSTLDITLISIHLSTLLKDPELDPYVVALTYLLILQRKEDKPLSKYIISDPAFKRTLISVDSSFYGRKKTDDFHFAKYYYLFFVVYAKNVKIAERYDHWLGVYEDAFQANNMLYLKHAKKEMDAIIEQQFK